LRTGLERLPAGTKRVLFFVPYNHVMFSAEGSPAAIAWNECKRRVAALPDTLVVDFMRPSPITEDDNNYWDAKHYRVAIAERLAHDLAAAARGAASEDFRVLASPHHGRP
jgi:hypothetical protein